MNHAPLRLLPLLSLQFSTCLVSVLFALVQSSKAAASGCKSLVESSEDRGLSQVEEGKCSLLW